MDRVESWLAERKARKEHDTVVDARAWRKTFPLKTHAVARDPIFGHVLAVLGARSTLLGRPPAALRRLAETLVFCGFGSCHPFPIGRWNSSDSLLRMP